MPRLSDGLAGKSVQRHITFGVSKLWIPHVTLIYLIYYILLSPHQYADRPFWTLGTFIRLLVGRKVVNVAVAFMWIVHVFEAAYTVALARRYGTTSVVGVRCLARLARKRKLTELLNCYVAILRACYTHIRETWVGRAFKQGTRAHSTKVNSVTTRT